eukprot:TRINITY_DN29179_c0_g1_i1.p2 TRINITY_DN29179_c0_g1~~TRINITY_DN29179_c0_g1_i1.p2  ORF type:complete len:164 (-),score=0.60 TRINITY_DN29179_c0_g1_i1:276-767(-)
MGSTRHPRHQRRRPLRACGNYCDGKHVEHHPRRQCLGKALGILTGEVFPGGRRGGRKHHGARSTLGAVRGRQEGLPGEASGLDDRSSLACPPSAPFQVAARSRCSRRPVGSSEALLRDEESVGCRGAAPERGLGVLNQSFTELVTVTLTVCPAFLLLYYSLFR